MNSFILNGQNMTTREAAYDEIARVLDLPDYFGRNLDALWDCIRVMDAEVRLVHAQTMLDELGSYGSELLHTLQEASESHPGFRFSAE